MGKIHELFDWIKRRLHKKNMPPGGVQSGRIHILRRSDSGIQPLNSSDGGKITIGEIHGPSIGDYQRVPIDNPELSGGIHVTSFRKPVTCPICRTTGRVVKDPEDGSKWKCNVCENTF